MKQFHKHVAQAALFECFKTGFPPNKRRVARGGIRNTGGERWGEQMSRFGGRRAPWVFGHLKLTIKSLWGLSNYLRLRNESYSLQWLCRNCISSLTHPSQLLVCLPAIVVPHSQAPSPYYSPFHYYLLAYAISYSSLCHLSPPKKFAEGIILLVNLCCEMAAKC